jgi:catecholate siderophore receptor
VALVLVLGAPGSAFGQDARPSQDTTVQTLEPLNVVGKASGYSTSLSSSATKTPTPLRDVPQSVTAINKDLIVDQNMQGMADAVRYIPGVTMGQGEGNRDQPTIRGNGTTAAFFVDGMRDDVQYFRDLYNVERVEGLKGANALIFGRGVGGGVLNRVTKTAQLTPVRSLALQGGSYGNKRGALDVGDGVSEKAAVRLNAMYENSDLYRQYVSIERYGFNPTVTILPSTRTLVTASYEHFKDDRTADRGVPSFAGAPVSLASVRTFFGDPAESYSNALVNIGTAAIEHTTSGNVTVRNATLFADYDKSYQNVFPGAVNGTGTEVSISAYNNMTKRRNMLNQTEVTYRLVTGAVSQTWLGGVAVGRQITDNFRETGFFNDATTSVTAPLSSPTISIPLTFRQSASDANNHSATTTMSVYAQNQIVLSRHWQAIAGIRYESFDITFFNNRTSEALARNDDLISPRAGLLFKPIEPVTFYLSYGVSALPSSGDQFSSLTATTETLEPEKFTNYEFGAKWDIVNNLSVTSAVYRLDRTNTTAPDPNDPTRTVQTGSQRTTGFEFGVTGAVTPAWQIIGGYTNQDAEITSETSAASVGAKVPVVPQNTVSFWNRYRVAPMVGLGLGIIYQDKMFAAIDNAVTLPSFIRFDAAAFLTLSEHVRAQVNVENLFDKGYFVTSHNNNNISPGSPRALRASVVTEF